MKKLLSFLTLIIGVSSFSIGQTIEHKCAVGVEDGALIKQRLFENRANIDIEQFRNRTSITWIPITFHLIGDANGEGYVDTDDIFRTVCSLNSFYEDQNVQFYIQFPFLYFDSQSHYDDISSASSNQLVQQKVPNTINIFTGPSVNNPASSFYNPQGDYLFLLEAMAQGEAQTLAHEVGHFFTLNHTFYGWENIDCRDYEGGPSPSTIGGGWWSSAVEYETRGTGANCNAAADGFCDTPADYISYRAPCPMTNDIRDPQNVAIDPDETNIMSYYYDQCVGVFTQDQKDAVYADIVARGWTNFPAPDQTHNLEDDTAHANFPMNGDTVGMPIYNEFTLNWDEVQGAGGYWLILARTHEVAPISYEILIDELIMDPTVTSYVVDTTAMQNPEHYRWRVTPFNSYLPCADYGLGNYHRFYFSGTSNAEAGDSNGNGIFDEGEIAGDVNGNGIIDNGELTGDLNGNGVIDNGEVLGDKDGDGVVDATAIEEEAFADVKVYPNPFKDYLIVELNTSDVSLVTISDITGKVLQTNRPVSSVIRLNTETLSEGIYFLTLSNGTQVDKVKFVKVN